MGFGEDGDLVVLYKCIESTVWIYLGEHNYEISGQRMVNEWGMGFVNTFYRLFLGSWPFEHEIFPVAYNTAVMVANWLFDRRGFALQTLESYKDKLHSEFLDAE